MTTSLPRRQTAVDLTLLGRDLLVLGGGGELTLLSFERNEIKEWKPRDRSATPRALSSWGRDFVVTAEEDGTMVVLNLREGSARLLSMRKAAVSALSCDLKGSLYAALNDGGLIRISPDTGRAEEFRIPGRGFHLLKPLLRNKMLAVSKPLSPKEDPAGLCLFDFERLSVRHVELPSDFRVTSLAADAEGRIIAGLARTQPEDSVRGGNLLIFEFGNDRASVSELPGHRRGTRDCLTSGPRLISCGEEESGETALRVWGAEYFVRTELGKLAVRKAWPAS